jgi:HlyD family secretion protein
VRIDETAGLLPGMNVSAEIVLNLRENVPAIPVAALERGNRVLVKTAAVENPAGGGSTDGAPVGAGRPDGGERPAGAANGAPTGAANANLPEGYTYRQVTTGVSDGSYIEILSGLREGDEIAFAAAVISGENRMFGGMRTEIAVGGGGQQAQPGGGNGGNTRSGGAG